MRVNLAKPLAGLRHNLSEADSTGFALGPRIKATLLVDLSGEGTDSLTQSKIVANLADELRSILGRRWRDMIVALVRLSLPIAVANSDENNDQSKKKIAYRSLILLARVHSYNPMVMP